MMSIADFAERTGLPPSTLRFYESKGILRPAERLDNGYRCYTEDQVNHAKLINSLRQSGISLTDIRRFMEAEEIVRAKLLEQWRREAEARMLSIQIANQYLNGIHPNMGSLHLTRWDEPVTLLWQTFTLTKPLNSYSGALGCASDTLRAIKVRTQGTSVIRVIESLKNEIKIEVGFQVAPPIHQIPQSLPLGAYLECIPPTLFITADCSWDDMNVCMRTIRFLQRFGFEPTSKRMERHFPHSSNYELMIPVAQSQFSLDLQVT